MTCFSTSALDLKHIDSACFSTAVAGAFCATPANSFFSSVRVVAGLVEEWLASGQETEDKVTLVLETNCQASSASSIGGTETRDGGRRSTCSYVWGGGAAGRLLL